MQVTADPQHEPAETLEALRQQELEPYTNPRIANRSTALRVRNTRSQPHALFPSPGSQTRVPGTRPRSPAAASRRRRLGGRQAAPGWHLPRCRAPPCRLRGRRARPSPHRGAPRSLPLRARRRPLGPRGWQRAPGSPRAPRPAPACCCRRHVAGLGPAGRCRAPSPELRSAAGPNPSPNPNPGPGPGPNPGPGLPPALGPHSRSGGGARRQGAAAASGGGSWAAARAPPRRSPPLRPARPAPGLARDQGAGPGRRGGRQGRERALGRRLGGCGEEGAALVAGDGGVTRAPRVVPGRCAPCTSQAELWVCKAEGLKAKPQNVSGHHGGTFVWTGGESEV